MRKAFLLSLLGGFFLAGHAQTFREWQDPEVNAINRAPMHSTVLRCMRLFLHSRMKKRQREQKNNPRTL